MVIFLETFVFKKFTKSRFYKKTVQKAENNMLKKSKFTSLNSFCSLIHLILVAI